MLVKTKNSTRTTELRGVRCSDCYITVTCTDDLDYFHALLPRSRDRIPMRSNITTDPIAAIEARSNSHLLWDARNLLPLPAP